MDRTGVVKPRVHVCHSHQLLSEEAGDLIARLSHESISARGSFLVAFSGGSLPGLVAPRLLELKDSIEWERWVVFFADERRVCLDDRESNRWACHEHLFRHVPIPSQHIHAIDPSLPLQECAKAYQAQLESAFEKNGSPRFDLILLGMGPDGHTCSLFPFHPLLKEETALVAPICDSPKPPPERVTFTLPLVNDASNVAFVVTGDSKKEVLFKILEGKEEKEGELPSKLVWPKEGNLYWFVDQPAASLLQVYVASCSL